MNPLTHSSFFNKVMICVKVSSSLPLTGDSGSRKRQQGGVEKRIGGVRIGKGLGWFVISWFSHIMAVVQEVIGLNWYFIWLHFVESNTSFALTVCLSTKTSVLFPFGHILPIVASLHFLDPNRITRRIDIWWLLKYGPKFYCLTEMFLSTSISQQFFYS